MSDDVRETLTVLSERMGGKTAKDGLYIFNALLKEFDLGFPKAEESILDGFVSKVNVSRLGNHPTPLTAEDVKEIYRRVLCE